MKKILHRIRAFLYKNLLTGDPNDYSIRVASERSLNTREICNSAADRGGADISAAAMEHAVELWLAEMGYQILDGFSINTGWFTASIHIKGVCKAPDEHYDPEKHTIVVEFHQGMLIRKEIPNITVEFQGPANVGGHIGQVVDLKTGSINDMLTPGRNLRISGEKIKVIGENSSVGIYFCNPATSTNVKVDPSDIIINNPSEVIIIIPQLDNGSYLLEIITQYTPSNLLKNPRSIRFNEPLSVKQ
ncbi:MAG: DUF4469 domain-containing protein [Tannerella sp.]|jgi:hypothetical protein|nr:DUF4469 domain-containing protein [Tannerella sp.]